MEKRSKIIVALLVVLAIELAVLDWAILVRGLSVERIEVVE